jgi:DNA-binding beta-propeller fold protein YncE
MFRAVIVMIFLICAVSANAAHQVKFVAEIPVEKPLHVASNHDGNIYVTTKEAKIAVFSMDGKSIRTIQENDPAGDPYLKKPAGIAVYGDRIYVCDRSRDKVFIFSREGKFIDSFGEGGSGRKQFSNPEGIFVYQGVIYVADYGNDRIQAFSDTGVHLQTIGATGNEEQLLKSPTDVAVDNRGNIYAIDKDRRIVKIYAQSGRYLGKISAGAKPFSLAISDDGIFVTDVENHNVSKFNFKGEKLFHFGTYGDGKVQFKEIVGISADNTGRVYVVDSEKKSIQIIDTDRSVAIDLPLSVAPPTSVRWQREIKQPARKVAWDRGRNLVYAIDSEKKAVNVLKDGKLSRTLVLPDRNPVAIAIDQNGTPWVFDKEESQLLKLDQDGKILLTVGSSGSREGYFSRPKDICLSRDGSVYVADTNNDRIQVFNSDGVFLNAFTKGPGGQPLESPIAIDLDSKGNLYVLLGSSNKAVVLSPNGDVLREFGGKPPGEGTFDTPVSLAVAGNELMVLDAGNNNIKVFTLSGEFKREFGSKGEGKGDFVKPSSIAVLDGGSFMVSDSGNERLQELVTVSTPFPPGGLTAVGGMRKIEFSWKSQDEVPVESYRIFRSVKDEAGFKEVAVVKGNSYEDRDVLPGAGYSYKVSALARGGNENISIETASAVPLKYTPKPPVSVDAKSQEWSVDLSWQAERQDFFDHYAVYRDSDEEDVPPVFLGNTKETKFSEEGLESDTEYTYLVSAFSIDGVESERVAVDVSTLVATKPPLEIEIIKMSDIFSNTYKIYENEGIGKVKLTNNTRNEIRALKLAFSIKEYMDYPSELEIKSIPPGQSTEITLKAVFNNRILEVTEDTPVQTELKASYFENQKQRVFVRNNAINLYEKHRMMWVTKDRVATFVTSKDPAVLEFARSIVTQYSDIGSPLVYAAAIYDYMGLTGMTYLQHPNNPYQIVEGKTNYVDYVQYPRETLKRNSGVCTDLVVFFSAVLEGLGIRTMLLGTPDHLFMMFAVGQVADLGDSTMNGMFAIHEGTVWAPIELTLVGSTFMKAWETGSGEYFEWRDKGIEITDLGRAWGRYKPATLPVTEWRAPVVKRTEIDNRYGNEIAKLHKMKLKYTSNRYFAQVNNNPSDGNAYLQLGIIYGESGELDDARKYLEKAQILMPERAEVFNNLGNVMFLKGDFQAASKAYVKASELDPADPNILVNLALCYVRLEDKEKAADVFRKATQKDPVLLKKHRTIAIELLGSM